jgi:hypothetical protein
LGFTSSFGGTSKQNCRSFRTYGGGKISGVVAILPSSSPLNLKGNHPRFHHNVLGLLRCSQHFHFDILVEHRLQHMTLPLMPQGINIGPAFMSGTPIKLPRSCSQSMTCMHRQNIADHCVLIITYGKFQAHLICDFPLP